VTLRSKLLLAQVPLALVLMLLGYVAVRTLDVVGQSSQNILKDNYRSVLAAQRMKECIERVDSAALFLVAERPDKGDVQATLNRRLFEEELVVQEGNITEAGELEATKRLRALWGGYQETFDRFRRLTEGADRQRAYFAELEPQFVKVKRAADVILSINQDTMMRKSDLTQHAARRMTVLLILASLCALVVGVVSSATLTSRLLRPLNALSGAVQRLGGGDMDARALVVGKDEIADLAREFNTMATRLAQYRKSSLGDLLQAQQSSQAAIDSLPDPVVIFGGRGELLSANRAALETLGIDLEAGEQSFQRVVPVVRETIERVRAHVLGGKGAYTPHGFEEAVRAPLPSGERAFLPRATPVLVEEGGVMGAAVVLQDVTKLIFFDQFKTDMVATVAHEFRTPLTSLHMAIHLCLEGAAGPTTEKQADLLQAAREDCERLQSIVTDLLDASRIQSGRLELTRSSARPADLLQIAMELRETARSHGLQCSISDETAADDAVSVDLERVRLVLSNLIQNAIRHTPSGGEVKVVARPLGASVRFEVSDTGDGIPAEYHQRIFEKYFQVPGVSTGSAGLGLYISREVVLAHGGDMGVQSEPGKGSTFWFTLPKERTA
jgi:signal transduction histidine kinase/HAMP domain-containing protein